MSITIGRSLTMLRKIPILLLITLVMSNRLLGDSPTVTAVLSNSEVAVGQMVQMAIKVTGANSINAPEEIVVDGLEIHPTGTSRQFEMRNFASSSSITYNYTIMPLKAGRFKIPSQPIRAGGATLKTPELTLNVADSGGPSGRSGRANQSVDTSKIAFAELILTKSSAYVGEMIPAVVRLGFYVRTPVESLGNGIDITGQGFTTQKMRDPRQTIETIDGKSYQTFTFKTAISPARSGQIEIGPVEVNPVVRIPRTSGMPQDPFGRNDPFFNNFFNDPAFAPSVPQEIKLKSESTTLEVKPLPAKAPPSFAGAVGNFSMTSEAKPKKVQVGDPFTITAKIAGRGNFDRVTAPAFEEENGWHKYPPSANFAKDDDIGISGTKTFETVLSPNERKDHIPAQLFTYFDPVKEEYVTLRSEPVAVRVEGGAAPTVAAATPAAAGPGSPTPATKAATKQQDILYQLTELPNAPQSFAPLFARRSFWLAQLAPLLALLGFVGWRVRQARLRNRDAQRRDALQQEAMELQRSLRRDDVAPQEYFSRASRAVQLKTALAKNLEPSAVDAEVAAAVFRADDNTRERLRHLFARSDEVRYSGGPNGGSAVSPETRNEVLDLIENLRA
ncbi:MAG: BatD family protein [Verrucomicrobiota bacterium]